MLLILGIIISGEEVFKFFGDIEGWFRVIRYREVMWDFGFLE